MQGLTAAHPVLLVPSPVPSLQALVLEQSSGAPWAETPDGTATPLSFAALREQMALFHLEPWDVACAERCDLARRGHGRQHLLPPSAAIRRQQR